MKKYILSIGLFMTIVMVLWFALRQLQNKEILSLGDYQAVLISFLIVVFLTIIYGAIRYKKSDKN